MGEGESMWIERLRRAAKLAAQTSPAIWGMGVLVWASEGSRSLEGFLASSTTALTIGVPLVFLIGVGVQLLPKAWYQR